LQHPKALKIFLILTVNQIDTFLALMCRTKQDILIGAELFELICRVSKTSMKLHGRCVWQYMINHNLNKEFKLEQ